MTTVDQANSTAVLVPCGGPNDYNGRLGLRISSIFVIGFGSLMGALLPVVLARSSRMRVPKLTFFVAKYFGSGVIIATAFIHLLAPATQALQSPCLSGPIAAYSWAEGIALMTVFVMFFIELMANRFEIFSVDVEGAHDPSMDVIHRKTSQDEDKEITNTDLRPITDMSENGLAVSSDQTDVETGMIGREPSNVPGRDNDVSYPPGGEDHMGHQRDHAEMENFAAQMTALFILEFGVIFHSIFIGLTLAVAGDEFTVLYIVLVFHQTFEGLGLGSRLATARWPRNKRWMPYVLGTAYGLTTPLAIAVGLGVRATFSPGSIKVTIINGVFDSISAGILIYTGLVELMAHEFMFNQEMRKSSMSMMLFAFGCMAFGAGLMALLGKWA
ncbi:MAG: hypothetical protein M1818_007299 [Claussenomyces sp. TS43310]|nr:MAG: hypothetical protein M1818_007299 [Claussenomyces sp. TS43310]